MIKFILFFWAYESMITIFSPHHILIIRQGAFFLLLFIDIFFTY